MPSGTRRPEASWYKGQLSPSSSLFSHTCPTFHLKVPRPGNKAVITPRDPGKDMIRASTVDRLKDTLDHLKGTNPSPSPRPLSFNNKKRRVVVVAVLASHVLLEYAVSVVRMLCVTCNHNFLCQLYSRIPCILYTLDLHIWVINLTITTIPRQKVRCRLP